MDQSCLAFEQHWGLQAFAVAYNREVSGQLQDCARVYLALSTVSHQFIASWFDCFILATLKLRPYAKAGISMASRESS